MAGRSTMVGSRSRARAQAIADELRERWPTKALSITGGTNDEAADADLVVVALPWDALGEQLPPLAERLAGKVVISMVNALQRSGGEFRPLVPARGSMAAEIASFAPGARVVAALHHVPARELGEIDLALGGDVLVCGDDDRAVAEAAGLVTAMRCGEPVPCGSLSLAGALESLTAALLNVNAARRTRSTLKLVPGKG
jgi:NADPH-dependent F420 reductase